MKRKILTFVLGIALFMLIPSNVVKASNTTIDEIITKLNERIAVNDSFISGIGTNINIEKKENNKIRITATTDISEAYASWPEGFIDEEELLFTSFIDLEYENSILSYKGDFGYIDGEHVVNYNNNEKDAIAELLSTQNSGIIKEILYISYNLKTGKNYNEIKEYLQKNGLESTAGILLFPQNTPNGITIRKATDGWINEYSINLDEISIPDETQTPIDPETPKENKGGHAYATEDNRFSISFIDEFDKEYIFSVNPILETIKYFKKNNVNEEVIEEYNNVIDETKKLLSKDGNLIDVYEIKVKENDQEKTEGIFTFKIKLTDEMKKFKQFELINIDTNSENKLEKKDIVKMKIDGEYLVGELPHLSAYALVGKTEKTENPKTGIATYTTLGLLTLITLSGTYMLYKNKMNKI